jgi:hypothetical protein
MPSKELCRPCAWGDSEFGTAYKEKAWIKQRQGVSVGQVTDFLSTQCREVKKPATVSDHSLRGDANIYRNDAFKCSGHPKTNTESSSI